MHVMVILLQITTLWAYAILNLYNLTKNTYKESMNETENRVSEISPIFISYE